MENLLPPFKGGQTDGLSDVYADTDIAYTITDTAPLSISHLHWKHSNSNSNDISLLAYAKAKGKSLRELKEDLEEEKNKEEQLIVKMKMALDCGTKKTVEIPVKGGGGEYLVNDDEMVKSQQNYDLFPEGDEKSDTEASATGKGEGTGAGTVSGEETKERERERIGGKVGGKYHKKQCKEKKLWGKKKMMGPSPLSVYIRGSYEEMTETIKLPEEKTVLKLISYLTVLNGVDNIKFDVFSRGVTNKNNIIHRSLPSQSTFTTLIYGNPLPLALPPHLTSSNFEKGLTIQEIKKIKEKRQEDIQEFMYQQSYEKINTGLLLSFISELSLAQQERGGSSSYTVKFEPCLSLGLDLAFDKKLQLVYVHKVKPATQADENGCIKKGDYVREIQGIHVTNLKQISLIADARNKNEIVSIRFERKKSKQRAAAAKNLLSSFFQQELDSSWNDDDNSSANTNTANEKKEGESKDDEKTHDEKEQQQSRDQKNYIGSKLLYEDENVLLAERTVLGNDATTTALMDGDNTNDNIIAKINNNSQDPASSSNDQNVSASKIIVQQSGKNANNTDWNTKFRLRKLKDIARILTISEEDDIPVIFNFQNQSLRYNIKVGWVDYEGKRHGRNILGPGKAYMEQSYSTHPWLLRLEDIALPPDSSSSSISLSETEEKKTGALDDDDQTRFEREIPGPDHGLLVRVGIEAASAGAYYTILWNPEIKSTSIMGMQKADGGRLTRLENEIKCDPTNSDLSSYENRKLRYSMQQLVQERRNNTDVGLAGIDSKGLGGWKGPLVTIILVDKDPRLKV